MASNPVLSAPPLYSSGMYCPQHRSSGVVVSLSAQEARETLLLLSCDTLASRCNMSRASEAAGNRPKRIGLNGLIPFFWSFLSTQKTKIRLKLLDR